MVIEKGDKEIKIVFDILGGIRVFLIKEFVEELLRLLLEVNFFIYICLSNWSFGDGFVELVVCVFLILKNRFVDLNFVDIVVGRLEVEVLNVMSIIFFVFEGSKFKFLNLFDNVLGEKGIRVFFVFLSL